MIIHVFINKQECYFAYLVNLIGSASVPAACAGCARYLRKKYVLRIDHESAASSIGCPVCADTQGTMGATGHIFIGGDLSQCLVRECPPLALPAR